MRRTAARGASAVTLTAASVLLAGLAVVAAAGPAAAHAELAASTPADQSELTEPPTSVTLTFSEAVSPDFSDVVVTGPDGATWQDGPAAIAGSVLTQPLRALSASGRYVVAYRIVSDDGHPVSGELSFTLTVPGTATPTTTPAAPSTGETTGGSEATFELTPQAAATDVVDPAGPGHEHAAPAFPMIMEFGRS